MLKFLKINFSWKKCIKIYYHKHKSYSRFFLFCRAFIRFLNKYFMWFKWLINKLKNSAKWLRNKIKKSPLYWRTMLIFFLIAFIIKIFVIYLSYRHLDPIKSCLSYISSDIIILFLAQLLITVNSRIKIRWWRLLNDAIVLILLIIYCVDIFVIFFFQSRVSISEAFTLWSNGSVGFAWAVRNRTLIFLIIWFL